MEKEVKDAPASKTEEQAPENASSSEMVSETKHSNNKVLIIVLAAIGVMVVLGIASTFLVGSLFNNSKAGEKILETALNSDISTDKDGNTTIKSNDGTYSASTEQKLPSDFPTGIPLYPNQKIISSTKIKNDTEAYWSVSAETNDSAEGTSKKAKDIYSEWDSESESEYNGVYISTFKKGDLKVGLSITETSGKATITYSVTQTLKSE